MGISSYSQTPASNTTISGINIGEGCAPSGINDAIRQMMADVATDVPNKNAATGYTAAQNWAQGTDIVAASTTPIGAATGNFINVTGNTTITAFDTVQAGTLRALKFTGAPLLTYNSTTMQLPGVANIQAAAGDTSLWVSLGSGNWKCLVYQTNSGVPTGVAPLTSPNFVTGAQLNSHGLITQVKRQVFPNGATYTPTPGMVYCDIECMAGGGGGGGLIGATGSSGGSGGGGSGSYSRKVVLAATIGVSQVVTIGAAGTGGTNAPGVGGAGGTTSVGAICTANGGSGGQSCNGGSTTGGGAAGAAGTGDIAAPGQFGGYSVSGTSALAGYGGFGGSTMWGAGGNPPITGAIAAGQVGSGYGAGGSGASYVNSASATTGAAGQPGLAVITEYISA